MLPKEIFRAYDIRGTHPDQLTNQNVNLIGKAVGTFYRRRNIDQISIGHDCRVHAPEVKEHFVSGILSTGVNVIYMGMLPTPGVYYSQFHWDLSGGVMITGSHNPKEYNGFKICLHKSTIAGDDIQEIYKLASEEDFETGEGKQSEKEIFSKYIERITEDIKIGPHLKKVVVDSANGTGGPPMKAALEKLGVDATYLYNEPDGNFPNHHPDPSVAENYQDLINKVKEENADLGIAFDGDSDRFGLVDEEGEIIWGDMILLILGRELAKTEPGAKVIGEVKCSKIMYDELEKIGLKPIMAKVGHSFIKQRLKKENAALAGEVSGHFFYKNRYYGYDDAVYTALRFLEIASATEQPVSKLTGLDFKPINTPELRYPVSEDQKVPTVNMCQAYFEEKGFNVIDIDGVRVNYDGGWALVRPSNTTPYLILRFEANDEESLERYKNEMYSLLDQLTQDI